MARRLPAQAALLIALTVGLLGCGSAAATIAPTAAPTPTAAATVPPVAAECAAAPLKFDPKHIDLTGAWAGDDGGVYYVTQRGNVIWWNGMAGRDLPPEELGRDWNNVGRGVVGADLTIQSDWVDVPRGGTDGYGTVTFKIGPDASGNIQIAKTSETGTGRGDSLWTRCTPGFPPQ